MYRPAISPEAPPSALFLRRRVVALVARARDLFAAWRLSGTCVKIPSLIGLPLGFFSWSPLSLSRFVVPLGGVFGGGAGVGLRGDVGLCRRLSSAMVGDEGFRRSALETSACQLGTDTLRKPADLLAEGSGLLARAGAVLPSTRCSTAVRVERSELASPERSSVDPSSPQAPSTATAAASAVGQ